MKLSDLSELQRGHLAWRLDHKTTCGYLTAHSVAFIQHGDLDIVEIFKVYGGCTEHSAKINAAKVRGYPDNFT